MNLFLHECKTNIKTFCFWTIGIILLVLISAGKTTSMVGQDNQGLESLLSSLPQSIQTVFGVGIVDYSTAIGVFAIVFTYVALIAAFHAASLGVSSFGKEERDRTFEFLYVKGKTRRRILTDKLFSALAQMILLNLITFVVSIASVKLIFDDNIFMDYLPMAIGMFFIQLVFFGIGLLASLAFSKIKTASNLSMSVVIITFLIAIGTDFSESIAWMKYFSPFKYFDGKEMLTNGIQWEYGLVCVVITLICVGISYCMHDRRDLHC